MYLVHLALLHVVACIDIQVEGDVAFDVRVSNGKKGKAKAWFRQHWEGGKQEKELVFKMMQLRHNVTVAPEMECIYQYPETDQVNAVLSNMMNELTKVFVRAKAFINGEETRRGGALRKNTSGEKKTKDKVKEEVKKNQTEKLEVEAANTTEKPFRSEDSRFKVVDKKQKAFFEVIYANMTKEYKDFYNSTAERVDRSGRDACAHQDEVKQIWRDLLEHAFLTLKTATYRCMEEYLDDEKIKPKSKIRFRLNQYLVKELSKVRASQLDMLCDKYQLCYNELLE